jgi:hypothetical protein
MQWLFGEFSLWGIRSQHRMPIVAGLVAFAVLFMLPNRV